MKNRIFRKSKKGVSLVEEICAVCILAIGVFAAVAAIGMARGSVTSDSVQETAAAQAQELADNLISALSQKSAVPAAIDYDPTDPGRVITVGGVQAVNVGDENGFSTSDGGRRFYITEVKSKNSSGSGVDGYDIVCRVYYNGGKNYVQMKAYASARGNGST